MNDASESEERCPEHARSTEDVIAAALTREVDADGDDYWELIWILQARLPADFEKLKELAASDDLNSRDVAATVLGQNGRKEKVLVEDCVALLTSMLLQEESPKVQESLIYAMGHHHSLACLPTLLKFERHPNADVRYALTHSLGGLQDDAALESLCRLSYDGDRGIRSWATFGIGTLSNKKSDLIHDALVARLTDEDDEVRGEALVGLSERCEVCVARPFLRELQEGSTESLRAWVLIQDAAAAVEKCNAVRPQPEWEPVLAKLEELGISGKTKGE